LHGGEQSGWKDRGADLAVLQRVASVVTLVYATGKNKQSRFSAFRLTIHFVSGRTRVTDCECKSSSADSSRSPFLPNNPCATLIRSGLRVSLTTSSMGLPRNSGGYCGFESHQVPRGARIKQLSHPSADVIQIHWQSFSRWRIRFARLLRLSLDLFPSRPKHLDDLVKAKEGEDRTVAVHCLTVERRHTAEVGRRSRCGIDRHWCWNLGSNNACLHVARAQLLYLPLVDFHRNIEMKTHLTERWKESTLGHLFRFDSICSLERS
jgi:hypothetical protein